MRILFMLFTVLVASSLTYAGNLPSRIDVTRRDKGENGYRKVKLTWTGEDSGTLLCERPGYAACAWQYSGANGYPIDLDSYAEIILNKFESERTSSGTMIVGEISFHYWVLESFGRGEGAVRFEFISTI